jgi:hypothetical protein
LGTGAGEAKDVGRSVAKPEGKQAMIDETAKAAADVKLLVPASLMIRIAEYLSYRPYREVFQLIGEMQQASNEHRCPMGNDIPPKETT